MGGEGELPRRGSAAVSAEGDLRRRRGVKWGGRRAGVAGAAGDVGCSGPAGAAGEEREAGGGVWESDRLRARGRLMRLRPGGEERLANLF
jgi:hypothetical protein